MSLVQPTHDDLVNAFTAAGLSEDQAMNLLQGEAGVISDNCISSLDIAQADIPAAIAWLSPLMI